MVIDVQLLPTWGIWVSVIGTIATVIVVIVALTTLKHTIEDRKRDIRDKRVLEISEWATQIGLSILEYGEPKKIEELKKDFERTDEDRRIVKVALTDKGKHIHECYARAQSGFAQTLLEPLSDEEQAMLILLMRKISRNLQDVTVQ